MNGWRTILCRLLILTFLFFGLAGLNWPGSEDKMTEVKIKNSPPLDRVNSHYPGNKLPLRSNPLLKLPPGQVEARGWLLSQLRLMADGLTGRLQEISRFLQPDSGWLTLKGRGWEEMPYWLKGFGDLAYLLRDPEITASARKWIEAILRSQQSDGYFGPVDNRENNDLWPNMVALACLQSYYEYSGDRRVLDFMSAYFRYQHGLPEEKLLPGSWQKLRGGENLESVYWLYNRTGQKWLLELAEKIYRRTAAWASPILSPERDRNWEESSFYHGVNIAMGLRYPAVYYQQTSDRQLLEAVERNYRQLMENYGQQPGGMFAADENIRPGYNDPRQGAETCTMVEFMNSFESMLKITGDIIYADRAEEIAVNSLPAALTPDLKALHYLTAANLVSCDSSDQHDFQNSGTLLSFDPWKYRCCQHNVAFGWPYYIEHLWLATADDGLAAIFYGPSQVSLKVGKTGQTVRLVQDTDYPFSERIRLTLYADQPVAFPLYLRLPGWAEGAVVSVNLEKPVELRAAGKYVLLERIWKNGDQVELFLEQPVRVKFWPGIGQAASIGRGPLWYSLEIKEEWKRAGGSDDWPAWEVLPASPWNYALVLDEKNPVDSFRLLEKRAVSYQPFSLEAAPLVLEARARRLPNWKEEGRMVGRVPPSPVASREPEAKIRLIPMGCARLRITCFPWTKSK
ncbi:MAG: beta-L-arabinofuranosidase domain-containing protein [Candidatus Saccharicenans sp.]|uniref:beta-L-arabinofuranosidase domain-containing protein n=1 Tax=Candidatus Saccharicenans sp. TaxID=2819258 RepID=UPI00404A261E